MIVEVKMLAATPQAGSDGGSMNALRMQRMRASPRAGDGSMNRSRSGPLHGLHNSEQSEPFPEPSVQTIPPVMQHTPEAQTALVQQVVPQRSWAKSTITRLAKACGGC